MKFSIFFVVTYDLFKCCFERMSVAVKCASSEGSFPFGRIRCSVQLGSC